MSIVDAPPLPTIQKASARTAGAFLFRDAKRDIPSLSPDICSFVCDIVNGECRETFFLDEFVQRSGGRLCLIPANASVGESRLLM